MFNRIRRTAAVAVWNVQIAQEDRRTRKIADARLKEIRAYNEMIAESQAKIGPYKPATIPVQVWA
jgi:hypothetical protein